jgi:hypothetical protein
MPDSSYLSLQIGIICLLLCFIGSAAFVEHPEWFGVEPLEAVAICFADRIATLAAWGCECGCRSCEPCPQNVSHAKMRRIM